MSSIFGASMTPGKDARFARGSGAKRLSGHAANRSSGHQRPTDVHQKLQTLVSRLMLDDEWAMC